LGLIERDQTKIYNTAVVIEKGKLAGKYRKQHLLKKEFFFTAGNASPIFIKNDFKFGINICSDTRFADSAIDMAHKGTKLFFFPLNNSLPHETASKWKDQHLKYWQEIAKKTKNWVITSDVIEESQNNTGFGFSVIIDPNGSVTKSIGHLKEGVLTHQCLIN